MMSENTKEKILDSASKVFTVYGFAGASTVKIAKLANVSQGLVFHYFGSKENLWKAVNESLHQNCQKQSVALPDLSLSFASFIEALVNGLAEAALKNKKELRFSLWQKLENISTDTLSILPVDNEQLQDAFRYYQNIGEIDSGLDVDFLRKFFLSAISSLVFDLIFEKDLKNYKQYILFYTMRITKALG